MRYTLGNAIVAFILAILFSPARPQKAETWQICLNDSARQDEAVRVAVADLQKAGEALGVIFTVATELPDLSRNTIIVGGPARSAITAELVRNGGIQLSGIDEAQGYEIVTATTNASKTIVVAGGSLIGEVYGLYWIMDRLKVHKRIPGINVRRVPELKIRVTFGTSKADMRAALRNGMTWVAGSSINDLVPWGVEPEDTQNRQNRQKLKALIDYAHSLHLKYLAYTDEFTYHPALLKELGATLSPEDPFFWEAVQTKHRRALQALPELDGVMIRTGEFTQTHGNYRAFDVMHGEDDDSDWSLETRYRTFVKKVHNVVVGEFNKIYYQRTWMTNDYEQHSKAPVFQRIFTDEVPTRNLYLSPYINANDRWFFTAYNPTFNVTPHNMVILLAPMDYHARARVGVFPTFPGGYFQAGLQTVLTNPRHNLKGAQFSVRDMDDWNTWNVTTYVANRLAWNHNEDVTAIAEDFAAIHFGRAGAAQMAELYLLSPVAYKYGLYLEPTTHGVFNTLPQLRLTTFPAQGYPSIDHGKQHVAFLYKLYLKCKPWIPETLMYLDHGLAIANSMVEKYQPVKPLVANRELAQAVENSLALTHNLIKTNNLYVKTFLAYFTFRENPTSPNHADLASRVVDLKKAVAELRATLGNVYQLFGIEQLLKNAEQALTDLTAAEKALAVAPTPEEIERTIARQQDKYRQLLKVHAAGAVKLLHWEGKVDGRDILRIKGESLEVQHLRWDNIALMEYEFFAPLPRRAVTVIPDDIESRPLHPFVLEQPSAENNYTARIYLYDRPGGSDWFKFDLYYITKHPEELGLELPWQETTAGSGF